MLIPANTASSVTGVGHGSADRMNKGSEHMTLGVNHLVGTRVMVAGSAVIASGVGQGGANVGSAVVTFPASLDSTDTYVATLTPVVTASGSTNPVAFAVYGFSVTGFTIFGPSGGNGQTVNWTVTRL